jgi:HD-GYP domain-containing protein (c-di-GMP phosphodiesterase class II)
MPHDEALQHFVDRSPDRYDPEVVELLARSIRPVRQPVGMRLRHALTRIATTAD